MPSVEENNLFGENKNFVHSFTDKKINEFYSTYLLNISSQKFPQLDSFASLIVYGAIKIIKTSTVKWRAVDQSTNQC